MVRTLLNSAAIESAPPAPLRKAWICELSAAAFTTYAWLCKEHALEKRAVTGRGGMPVWLSVKQRLDKKGRPMPAQSCDVCQ